MAASFNLATDLIAWWYGSAFQRLAMILLSVLHNTADHFSIKILLKTLFEPWKRDVLSSRGLAFDDQIRIYLMNILSRLIGASVRSIVILIGGLWLCLIALGGLIVFFVWSFFPLLMPLGLIYGSILVAS